MSNNSTPSAEDGAQTPSHPTACPSTATTTSFAYSTGFVRDTILANARAILLVREPRNIMYIPGHSGNFSLEMIILEKEPGYAAVVMIGETLVIEGSCAPSIHQAVDALLEATATVLSKIYDRYWDGIVHLEMAGGSRIIYELPSDLKRAAPRKSIFTQYRLEVLGLFLVMAVSLAGLIQVSGSAT